MTTTNAAAGASSFPTTAITRPPATRAAVSMFPQQRVPADQRRPPDRHNPRAGEVFLAPDVKEQRTKYAKAVLTALRAGDRRRQDERARGPADP
eukprot:4804374-Prymnesium_polylepis.1